MVYLRDVNLTDLYPLILLFLPTVVFPRLCCTLRSFTSVILCCWLPLLDPVPHFLLSLIFCVDLQRLFRGNTLYLQSCCSCFYGNNTFGLNSFINPVDGPAPTSAAGGSGTLPSFGKTRRADTSQSVSTRALSSLLQPGQDPPVWLHIQAFLTYFQLWLCLPPHLWPSSFLVPSIISVFSNFTVNLPALSFQPPSASEPTPTLPINIWVCFLMRC